jgi:hypothetical protein
MLPHGLLGSLQNLRGLDLRDNKMTVEPELLSRAGAVVPNVNIRNNRNNGNNNSRAEHRNLHRLDISGRDMRMDKDLAAMMNSWESLRVLSLGRLQVKKIIEFKLF